MSLKKLTGWFEDQIGVSENPPGSNDVIYNTEFYGKPVSGPDWLWCCAFIWCGFHDNGMGDLFCGGEKTAYCPFVVNYARKNGLWVTEGYRAGDLLLYDWDGDGTADHIGFCVKADGALQTIEGNVGDSVQVLFREPKSVMGAYRPQYGETEEETPEEDTYTVKAGDSLWKIAWEHGMTYLELARINNLDPNEYIHPGQVLKLKPTDTPVITPDDDVYTVQPGDSLWGIAQKKLGKGWKWWRIAEANNLQAPYIIHPGDKLKIPTAEEGV